MKDAQGTELELGQHVAFTVGTCLVFGTIERLWQKRSYGRLYDAVKVRLDSPENAGIEYMKDSNGDYILNPDGSAMWRYKLKTHRDVVEITSRLVVCPKPTTKEAD